jgi:hypothetical protein
MVLVSAVSVATVKGATATVSLDRWMYPFAFTGGTRELAPTFGAAGTPDFDNRDGQFLIVFDTSSAVAPGLGAANYQINSVTIRAMVGSPAGFAYDPTYDSYRTYLPAADAEFLTDSDAGRPVELHGVGFRNGYTTFSFGPNDGQPPGFEESSPFGAPGVGTRNVFPLGFLTPGSGTDVANNVTDRKESNPWAIGTVLLGPGDPVPDNAMLSFAIDLANDDIRDYLQSGLNDGVLGFAITSLHTASQGGGGPPTPQFITRENMSAGAMPAMLEIDVQVVPEPGAAALAIVGAACAFCFAIGRRRSRKM